MEEITKIQRNHDGQVIGFQTSTGRIISYQKALMEAQDGVLSGVRIEYDGEGVSQLANSYTGDVTFSEYPEIF
ncbi:DUF3892 domain-containing protein [Bacillus sp. SCS-153A]|uniref:DUF3892 domain-containing protein n=1 Tax=Rossellomorea sedimentorum TaxID=3115294 RepID=UPI00390674B3